MKINSRILFYTLAAFAVFILPGCAVRNIPTAEDVTPGNPSQKLGWQYGARDIRIQTIKLNRQLMDRWFCATNYDISRGKPCIVVTEVDNCTDCYIPLEMVREIFEGVAVDDGRYSVVVGNFQDERELDALMDKIQCHPKYANPSCLEPFQAEAPHFLAKIRITKALSSLSRYDIEAYRMQITLYDIQTQRAIDSAWDVLEKKVKFN